jgi:SH3 domain protein
LRFSLPLLIVCWLFSAVALAEDIRYVSGTQNVALRSGAGDDNQIVHRGIPAGVRVIVARTSEDGLWAEITTDDGDTGWIPTQKLLVEPLVPTDGTTAIVTEALPAVASEGASDDMADTDATAEGTPVDIEEQMRLRDEQFNAVAQELYRLKRVSGQAEQLDIDNRRLVENTENLRSKVEMLQAENLRLHDKVESEDFMNGALAVLLGVVIALVAPRLVPKRRKNSGWA